MGLESVAIVTFTSSLKETFSKDYPFNGSRKQHSKVRIFDERWVLNFMKNSMFDKSFEFVFLTKMRKIGGVIGGERALKTGP